MYNIQYTTSTLATIIFSESTALHHSNLAQARRAPAIFLINQAAFNAGRDALPQRCTPTNKTERRRDAARTASLRRPPATSLITDRKSGEGGNFEWIQITKRAGGEAVPPTAPPSKCIRKEVLRRWLDATFKLVIYVVQPISYESLLHKIAQTYVRERRDGEFFIFIYTLS